MAPCLEQNRPLSSVFVNPIDSNQSQDMFDSMQQQQSYHYPDRSATMNHQILPKSTRTTTPTIPNGDHNDVSSTTATEVYSGVRPQPQTLINPTTALQPIGNTPKTILVSGAMYPPMSDQKYLPLYQASHASLSNMNDTRINMQMLAMRYDLILLS